ncbi:MAG: hypothetical protein JWP24_820 [Marmoricola sp.]|nr:hypothetical protein [Marmoricola sp.]
MTDFDIDDDTLQQGLSWAAIGFGAAATLTPRAFERLYGLKDSGELRVMTRLWGTRTIVLGAALLGADKDERRRLTTLAVAMNAADALITAGAGSEVNKRSRVLGSLSSAAFAAGYGSLLGRS